MALDTPPKLRKKQNLAFALETTTGTPASLAAAQGVTNVFNPDMKFNTEQVERQGQGNLSLILQGLGARAAACEFETELVGAATTGGNPSWLPLMQACGMALTGSVLAPKTGAIQTITIGMYIDGRFKQMSGAMGTFRVLIKRGQQCRIKWTFTGVQQPPSDVAIITPTYVTTPVAPRAGASFSFAGQSLRVSDIEIDQGNNVILREDVGAVDSAGDPTGYRSAYITGRKTLFKFAPESLPIATLDIYAMQRSYALSAMALTLGVNAGNIFTLSAPKLQILEAPIDGDREGMLTDEVVCAATRNTPLGDDEWTFTLS